MQVELPRLSANTVLIPVILNMEVAHKMDIVHNEDAKQCRHQVAAERGMARLRHIVMLAASTTKMNPKYAPQPGMSQARG